MVDWGKTIFYTEPVQDALGGGKRLYTTADDVFEIRVQDAYESRLYPGVDGWYGKVRFLVDEDEDAFEQLVDVAEIVETEYGATLDINNIAFYEHVKDERSYTTTTGNSAVKAVYNADHRINIPLSPQIRKKAVRRGTLRGGAKNVAAPSIAGIGIGGFVGAIAGAAGGPPGLVVGAGIGTALGSGAASLIGVNWTRKELEEYKQGDPSKPNWVAPAIERQLERYDGNVQDLVEQSGSFLEQVNERNMLNQQLAENKTLYDTDKLERREELNEKNLDEQMKDIFDVQFYKIDKLQGVVVSGQQDTYQDAIQFVGDITAAPIDDAPTRPSVFHNPDAVEYMSEYLVESAREQFLDNAWKADTTNEVDAALSEHFPELDECWLEKAAER